MVIMPEVDPKWCDGCGLCLIACHGGAIAEHEGRVRIVETPECDYCGVCEVVCPRGAIKCAHIVASEEVQS